MTVGQKSWGHRHNLLLEGHKLSLSFVNLIPPEAAQPHCLTGCGFKPELTYAAYDAAEASASTMKSIRSV